MGGPIAGPGARRRGRWALGAAAAAFMWAQNDCYYTFILLLLLLLSKPMSSPIGVETWNMEKKQQQQHNGRTLPKVSSQKRKRRQPRNVPGIRTSAPQDIRRLRSECAYVCLCMWTCVCVCKNLCFVCLFVYMLQCFVNCFLHSAHTIAAQ